MWRIYIFPLFGCAQIKRIGKIFSSDFSWIIKLLFFGILKLVKQIFKIYEIIFLILIFNFHRQECSLNIVLGIWKMFMSAYGEKEIQEITFFILLWHIFGIGPFASFLYCIQGTAYEEMDFIYFLDFYFLIKKVFFFFCWLLGCEIIHWFILFQGKAGKKVNFLFKQKINKNTWLKGNKWDYISQLTIPAL